MGDNNVSGSVATLIQGTGSSREMSRTAFALLDQQNSLLRSIMLFSVMVFSILSMLVMCVCGMITIHRAGGWRKYFLLKGSESTVSVLMRPNAVFEYNDSPYKCASADELCSKPNSDDGARRTSDPASPADIPSLRVVPAARPALPRHAASAEQPSIAAALTAEEPSAAAGPKRQLFPEPASAAAPSTEPNSSTVAAAATTAAEGTATMFESQSTVGFDDTRACSEQDDSRLSSPRVTQHPDKYFDQRAELYSTTALKAEANLASPRTNSDSDISPVKNIDCGPEVSTSPRPKDTRIKPPDHFLSWSVDPDTITTDDLCGPSELSSSPQTNVEDLVRLLTPKPARPDSQLSMHDMSVSPNSRSYMATVDESSVLPVAVNLFGGHSDHVVVSDTSPLQPYVESPPSARRSLFDAEHTPGHAELQMSTVSSPSSAGSLTKRIQYECEITGRRFDTLEDAEACETAARAAMRDQANEGSCAVPPDTDASWDTRMSPTLSVPRTPEANVDMNA